MLVTDAAGMLVDSAAGTEFVQGKSGLYCLADMKLEHGICSVGGQFLPCSCCFRCWLIVVCIHLQSTSTGRF